MKPVITVTKTAWTKMEKILSTSLSNRGFLFSVSSGGCNGFNFNLNLIKKEEYKNIIKQKPSLLNHNNVNLYVEPLSEMYLLGTTIDYVTEDYERGIFENKFVYKIDKSIASSCGCGVSFMPKNL